MSLSLKQRFYMGGFVFLMTFLLPLVVYARSTSPNFILTQEEVGPTETDADSANYEFKAEIGAPGVSTSTSANYIYNHGTWWMKGGGVKAVIQWAVPEMRVGAVETNDDAQFYLTVRTADNADDVILFTQPDLKMTNVNGTYLAAIDFTGIAPGVYDIGIKTSAHLTKVLDDVVLVDGVNTLNFSQLDNSAPKGAVVLAAGDVSNAGVDPASLGDDVVNSVDISIVLNVLDDDDLTGNNIRANLNQDVVVNSVDLSLMLSHLDEEGEN